MQLILLKIRSKKGFINSQKTKLEGAVSVFCINAQLNHNEDKRELTNLNWAGDQFNPTDAVIEKTLNWLFAKYLDAPKSAKESKMKTCSYTLTFKGI